MSSTEARFSTSERELPDAAAVAGGLGEIANRAQVGNSAPLTPRTVEELVAGDRLLCKRSSGHWTWAVVESIDDSTAGARAGVTCVVEANGRTKPVSREYWTQCLRAPLNKNVLHPPS